MLFIDNPVGAGFSFTTKNGYTTNQQEVSKDLYQMMLQVKTTHMCNGKTTCAFVKLHVHW